MKKSLYFAVILFCLKVQSTTGQTTISSYQPTLLIPYNDHGLWGWSDTLGNIVIKPSYDYAGFFEESQEKNGDEEYIAKVELDGNDNYFVFNKGLVIPRELSYIRRYYPGTLSTTLVLIKKKGKYGLYDIENRQIVVPTKYDQIWTHSDPKLFFRRKKDNYLMYNSKTRQLEKTFITEIEEWYSPVTQDTEIFYKDGNEEWYRLVDSKFEQVNFRSEHWKKSGELEIEELYLDTHDRKNRFTKKYNIEDTVRLIPLLTIDYSSFPVISERYGYKKLYVLEGSKGVGIKTLSNEIIVPVENDSLKMITAYSRLRYRGVIFYDEGRAGVKLFFTTYPMIKPKYDDISDWVKSLKVSESWSFGVYTVEYKGRSVFVGENGIEYFDFD